MLIFKQSIYFSLINFLKSFKDKYKFLVFNKIFLTLIINNLQAKTIPHL